MNTDRAVGEIWRRITRDGLAECPVVIHEMSAEKCRGFLARTWMGRLGCSFNDQPYVVPICFAYEDDFIYVFATVGQKIVWMRANPKVSLLVYDPKNPLLSVYPDR